MILFAIMNRVHLYMNSEIVLGKVERNYEEPGSYSLRFQYNDNLHIYDFFSYTDKDETSPIKILIPYHVPRDFVVFDFQYFIFWVLIIIVFVSGAWILFLQSFYPKRDTFFLFRTKKEPDEEA